MATSNMASAASSFVLTSNIPTNTTTSSRASISYPKSNSHPRRLVVRAEEAAAPPPAPASKGSAAPPPKPPPPPPIGPKRGTKVQHFSASIIRTIVTTTTTTTITTCTKSAATSPPDFLNRAVAVCSAAGEFIFDFLVVLFTDAFTWICVSTCAWQVKILRKESYWCNGIGSVVAVDQVCATSLPIHFLVFIPFLLLGSGHHEMILQ